jgi:hypothetical protein
MRLLLLAVAVLAACSPNRPPNGGGDDGVDANPGDPCTGSEVRCFGNDYQVCQDGTFSTQETCANVCTVDQGCIDCDPNAGNTCNGMDVVTCNPDGTYGPVVMSCGNGMMCSSGTCSNACTADGVDLIYVVDESMRFMSFDPRLLPGDPFKLIATLSCPVTGGSIQQPPGAVIPMSMSVDRDGIGWIEYTSGEVFNLSLTTGACTASGYVKQAGGMDLFGMGFVTDGPNTMTEKLYIAGGGRSAQPNGKLAHVDTHNAAYTPQQVGTLTAPSDYSPELTGTNEGKLYGFYPILTSGPAYVQEIDKTTGAPIGQKWNLGTTGLGGQIRDWAFAQWGNKFYIFITTEQNGVRNSTVRSIDKATSMYTIEKSNLPYYIPGAGVSTCAPSVIN